jgi:hypothetical protein
MEYVRIVVKDNYEKRGDLVLRSYIRGLKKINANVLLSNSIMPGAEKAYIYGEIKDGKFYEFFTNRVIDYDEYEKAPKEDINSITHLPLSNLNMIKEVVEYTIFGKITNIKLEVSTSEELAEDRLVESVAYSNYLSGVRPFRRLGEVDNDELYNGFNNFFYKLKMIKEMKKHDEIEDGIDDYSIESYESLNSRREDSKKLCKIK